MARETPSAKYLARANALAAAIDIAALARKACKLRPYPGEVKMEKWTRTSALHPEPAFATLKSLAYHEDAFLTFWNEAPGKHVAWFWREIAKRGLPYERRDIVREVIARGRIRNDIEREHVVDNIGDERFTRAETKKLSAMLGAYER